MASGVLGISTTLRVVIVSVPPDGIASRALITRLISTCSICPRSAQAGRRPGAGTVSRSIVELDKLPQQYGQGLEKIVDVERLRLNRLPAREGR